MTIFGVDISNYQAGLDLHAVAAEGFEFVFAKVSEGTGYRDPAWPGFRDTAHAAGLLLAGYHYVRADADPAAQAATFLGHLGDPAIPAMLDVEDGASVSSAWAVGQAINRRGGRWRLSYVPHWWWAENGAASLAGWPGLVASSYPTTAAGYASTLYAAVDGSHWAPYGGAAPIVLQFTDNATVAGHQVDANAYTGTPAQLAAALGVGAASSTSMPPEDAMMLPPLEMTGTGAKRFFTDTVGAPGQCIGREWLVLMVDGPDGATATVNVYPQRSGGGTAPEHTLHAQVLTDGTHTSSADGLQLPTGTNQAQLQWTVSGGATASLVPAFTPAGQ